MSRAILWDELWQGVKGQPRLVIAGSPRNSFSASVEFEATGGRALDGISVVSSQVSQPNSECRLWILGS